MKYEISKFFIKCEYNDQYILYSTLTTSLVILDLNIYKDIFENNLFSEHPEEVQTLCEMGFIHEEDYDEERGLKEQRKLTIETNKNEVDYFIVTPTMDCNARCYYCFEHGAHHETMTNTTAVAVANYIASKAKDRKVCIQWFGGEPLLAPEVIDLITDTLCSKNVVFESKITTNGYLLDDDMINKAIKWNVTSVQIPIDAIGDDYNRIKKFVYKDVDAFSTLIKNIKNLLKYNIRIRVRINFNPLNLEKVKKTIFDLREIFGIDSKIEFYCASIDSTSSNIPPLSLQYTNLNIHPLIELLDISEDFCGFNVKTSNPYFLNSDELTQRLKQYFLYPIPTSCFGVCNSTTSIDSLGNIYVCHRLLGKGSEYSSGNVWSDIKMNSITQYFQSFEISDKCRQCFLLPCCQGGCKLKAKEYGESHACSPAKGVADQLLLRALKTSHMISDC